jgi:hypothetical protein
MKELTDKRQDDEVVILNLLYCYIISDRYDEGYEYVEKLKALKILPYKLQDLLSFNNSGFIIFMQSLDKPELTSQAYDLLTRAEQIGTADNNPDIKYPFSSMVYYYIMNGELGKASAYVERLRELDITLLDEFEEDKKKNWYKKMENKRPSIQDDLRKLIPKKVNN